MNEAILLAKGEEHKTLLERLMLSKAILDSLRDDRYMSRRKLMNIFYLCEYHLQLINVNGIYYRTVSGPANYPMLKNVEIHLERMGWYSIDDDDQSFEDARYQYVDRSKRSKHEIMKVPDRYNIQGMEYIVKQMRPMDNEQTLMISSLYAVWNDLKISGKSFTDREIINEVTTRWLSGVVQIPKFRWQNTLAWLRSVEIIPVGFGRPTRIL